MDSYTYTPIVNVETNQLMLSLQNPIHMNSHTNLPYCWKINSLDVGSVHVTLQPLLLHDLWPHEIWNIVLFDN